MVSNKSMSVMIGFKVGKDFREFLREGARRENRSLSNFICHALLTYLKEHHGVEWDKETVWENDKESK